MPANRPASAHRELAAQRPRLRLPRWLALGALGFCLLAGACSDPGEGPEGGETPRGEGGSDSTDTPGQTQRLVGPGAGRWREPRTNTDLEDLTDEQRQQIADLEALGYVDGRHDAGSQSGVTHWDQERAQPGLNLLTSAHEPSALIMDASGEILHRWRYGFRRVWPDYPGMHRDRSFWRRTHLNDDGSLFAVYEGLGIIKVDVDSELLWKNSLRAHHDLHVMEDGTLWVLSREARVIPRVHPTKPVLEDFITLLGTDGRELRNISVLRALESSQFAEHWDGSLGPAKGDIFHTNSLERLDGSLAHLDAAFKEGNFLISLLILDMLAIVDAETEQVVWVMEGAFNRQHDPHVLDNGTILLFDNNTRDEASRIVELNPLTGEEGWTYTGNDVSPFYSETCGVAQRLPNGNTLITESDFGRAFEVTEEGRLVWEYFNTFRAGDEGQYIATMMEMKRLPQGFAPSWLGSQGGSR